MDTKVCDVSVIIPAYNAQEYLSDCLASLHHQTLSPKEIILVDDCSTDSTLSVAASWQERFAASGIDFQIVPSKQNQGAGNARNEGLTRHRGRHLFHRCR